MASPLRDPEALLITALRAQPSVATAVSNRIGTKLPSAVAAIRVTLVGGAGRVVAGTGWADLQVECWGENNTSQAETQAVTSALAVEAAMTAVVGSYGATGTIVAASVTGFLIHSPDPTSGRERYLLTVTVVMQ